MSIFVGMEQLPIWQIITWLITALLAIITFFAQLAIKSATGKIKEHDDDLRNQRMEIQELKTMIAMNTEADKYRMESMKKSFEAISDGIKEIKQSTNQQQSEMKTLDKRFTDFIIDHLRGQSARKS